MQAFVERLVLLMVLVRRFSTRRRHGIGPIKAAFFNEPLGLSGVGFILDTIIVPGDDSVQGTSLFRIVRSGAQAGPDRYLVLVGDACLEPIE